MSIFSSVVACLFAAHFLPLHLFAFFQRTPRFQFFLTVKSFFNDFIFRHRQWRTSSCCRSQTQSCNVSSFATCPACPAATLATFLCFFTSLLPWTLSFTIRILASFATCAPLCVPAWTLSRTPVAVARSFVNNWLCDVNYLLISLIVRAFAVILRGNSDLHWNTCVGLLLS